jgi:hypothetical protein
MRPSLIIGASLISSCLILGLFFGGSATGQSGVVPPVAAGRYQIAVAPSERGDDTLYVFEPSTGQCWYRSTAPTDNWTDLGSPTIKVEGKPR